MAGHSKWAQIKRKKAVKDAKKGAAFARCAREIMVAARMGGADPEGNFRLRTAIDRAKAEGLPSDNIKRAIEKGSGSGGGDQLESLSYEGYGPGGVAIYIEAMTDNRNRTAGDIRSYFNKYLGNLGADGCVAWLFEAHGLIQVAQSGQDEAHVFETALEAGATDFKLNVEDGVFELYTDPLTLNAVCDAMQHASPPIAVQSAEVTRIPKDTVSLTNPDHAKALLKLLDAIENQDDVQAVYANFEMDDALLETVSVG